MAQQGVFDAGNKVNTTTNSGLSQMQLQNQQTESATIAAAANLAHVEKCNEELKMLNIKHDVMREELQEATTKQASSRHAIKTKE